MPVIFGKAPGKIILFGEHAVVYGQPAIAIPVTKVKATARVLPNLNTHAGQIHLQAAQVGLDADLSDLPQDHPLAKAVWLTLNKINPPHIPSITIQISSTIPVSAGMGSSAAVSVAIIRALSAFLGDPLSPSDVSDLAYEVEKLHHGTPSGIDNNVIAHQKPVYFVREEPIQFLRIENPTHWVIADSGEKTPTRDTVSAVRALHAADADTYGDIFEKIGEVTKKARLVLSQGDITALGWLMNENQRLLEKLNLSTPRLDTLIQAARTAGAEGAKLSGGGRGGNMIALASTDKIEGVKNALDQAGSAQVMSTILAEDEPQ